MERYNLVSFGGIFVLLLVAWALSAHRRVVNFRAVGWGVLLQLLVGAAVFWAPGSADVMLWFNGAVNAVLGAAQAGQVFVFGPLATDGSKGFILATQALPMVIFFAAVMGLLYYWPIMPNIVRAFSWVFTRFMRISGAESLCTASNIFVGVEACTTIRPYLARMTRSELCLVLTAGMATVASTTMGLYVLFLKDTFPTIAGHLVSASLMSAPAAIVMSKLLVPETGEPVTLGVKVRPEPSEDKGAIDAVIGGAMAGVKLLVGVVALLIAFLGILALIDLAIGGVAGWFGAKLSLQTILGYAMQPLALVTGVPLEDSRAAGEMFGTRLVATEIPAYQQLAAAMKSGTMTHPRSAVIIAYSLCGFAHVASMAIFIGGAAALAPSRRAALAAVGPRALLAATLACLMTGAVAGTFFCGTSCLGLK